MAQELPSELDNIKKGGLIDLAAHSDGNFGLEGFVLSQLLDDIMLVEFIDEVNDGHGSAITRNGLFVPTNSLTSAWRKGKVILAGPNVRYCKPDSIVIFPNDKGASIANIEVDGFGVVKKGMFLNEQRIFGICKKS